MRTATLGDYDVLVALFDELDELHRQARPDFFRPFDGPARTREQIEQWLAEPGSTVLVAERGADVVGLAVLLTRTASPFAGAVPRKVIELDNIVVRADQRGWRVGRRLLAATVEWSRGQRRHPCRGGGARASTAMPGGSTRNSVSLRRSTGWCLQPPIARMIG